jgi:antitoxin component of MazEF toxin-antitoxin module
MPGPGESIATTLPDDLAGDLGVHLDEDIEINVVEDEPLFAPEPKQGAGESYGGQDPALEGQDLENDAVAESAARERRIRAEYERKLEAQRAESEETHFNQEKKNLATQRDAFKLSLDGVDVRLQTAREALKIARNDGDTNAETEIESQVEELRRIRGQIETNMSQLPTDDQLESAYKEHVAKRQQSRATEGVSPLNEKAGRWADKNSEWFNKDAGAMRSLTAINNSLVAEGYKPEDDEFFVELSTRMRRAHPALKIGGAQPRDSKGQFASAPKPPPVASVRSTAPVSHDPKMQAKQVNRNRVDLDTGDRRMMKMLGIDLENKAAVERFAREKLMRQKREQAGGY